MKSGGVPTPHVRFGPFEVDFETGEVCKHGLKLRLQEKPLRVLQALVEKPGKLVTREDLRNKLWPEDHHVDFDRNLTIAMNRLRTVLSDSAEEPRYIETLPRRGYRFIYPLDGHDGHRLQAGATTPGEVPSNGTTLELPAPTPAAVEQVPAQARPWSRVWLAGIAVVAVLLGIGTWYRFSGRANRPEAYPRVVPFTSSPGDKGQPVFSPDGKELAYAWRERDDGNAKIYARLLGAGTPLRLTGGSGDDLGPAWSPDGLFIAFLRHVVVRGKASSKVSNDSYYVVPALGGAERKVADAFDCNCHGMFGRMIDWSPDGKSLAAADLVNPQDARPSIVLISVESGERKAVLSQPDAFLASPAFSPDGRTIAFIEGRTAFGADMYVVPVDGGKSRRITLDGQGIGGLSWTPDGNHIVFTSSRGGISGLWKIPSDGGTPEPVATLGTDAYTDPAVSPRGDRLAYVSFKLNQSLWRAAGPATRGTPGAPAPLVASSAGVNEDVDISPDGKRIAFESSISGGVDIWTSNSDGTGQIQLTSMGTAGTPSWSPDGHMIAFDDRLEDHADIFVIGAEGGSPRRLTKERFENGVPSWSRDGRWVYFASDRTGRFEIWKVPSSGGAAVQVTKNGGFSAFESPDGKSVYYRKENTIWRIPTEGGEPAWALGGVDAYWWWRVVPGGICFVDTSVSPYQVKFLDFSTRHVRRVSKLDVGIPTGVAGAFAVSPDGKWIAYGHVDKTDANIMLLEGFH